MNNLQALRKHYIQQVVKGKMSQRQAKRLMDRAIEQSLTTKSR